MKGPKALLAATLLRYGVGEILTCNPKDVQLFADLRVIDPREAAAKRHLGTFVSSEAG
jgi:hypothetical protein